MVNVDILNYLKNGVKTGMKILELKGNLINGGWDKSEVDLAISELSKSNPNISELPSLPDNPDVAVIENSPVLLEENVVKEEKGEIVEFPIEEVVELPVEESSIKDFFSKSKIIIISIVSFVVLALILVFFVGGSGSEDIEGEAGNLFTDEIKEGVVIEFVEDSMRLKIRNKIKTFKIRAVEEYIVRYALGEYEGELFLKEDVVVDLSKEEIGDVSFRLEGMEDDVPRIYIKAE